MILGFSDDCCIFPFTYYGITINECIISPTTAGPPTTAGSLTRWLDDSPWCATEVNDDGSLKEWKNCDETCSGKFYATTHGRPEIAQKNYLVTPFETLELLKNFGAVFSLSVPKTKPKS